MHHMIHHPRSLKKISNTYRINIKEEKLLIDRVYDTSLVSDDFIIKSTINPYVDVEGFVDGIKLKVLQ